MLYRALLYSLVMTCDKSVLYTMSCIHIIISVSEDSCEETDSLNVTVASNDGSLYVPTPQRKVRESIKNVEIVTSKVCFMDLKQLDEFIKRVNQIRCATPGCKGALSPIDMSSVGLGGALSPMLVMVVLVSGHCVKHRLNTCLAMLQKLVLLHRWLLP